MSDLALEIAVQLGFRWFATDEGVLGKTRNIGFWRDAAGYPENGPELYTPWRFQQNGGAKTGVFSDYLLFDLVGFVYHRVGAQNAGAGLDMRIPALGSIDDDGTDPIRISNRTPLHPHLAVLRDRPGLQRLPHAPAVRRMAGRRVRGAPVRGLVPGATRHGGGGRGERARRRER